MVAPNGHPEKPIPDFSDQNGTVIAMGAYDQGKHVNLSILLPIM